MAPVLAITGMVGKYIQLYDLKKEKYWRNEIGQNGAIFNAKLDSCLGLNIYRDPETKDYFSSVKNLNNDASVLRFSSTPNGFYFDGEKKIDCRDS